MIKTSPTNFIVGTNTPGAYEPITTELGVEVGFKFRCPCGCGTIVSVYFEKPCPDDALLIHKEGELPRITLTSELEIRLGEHPVHWRGWLIQGNFLEDQEVKKHHPRST